RPHRPLPRPDRAARRRGGRDAGGPVLAPLGGRVEPGRLLPPHPPPARGGPRPAPRRHRRPRARPRRPVHPLPLLAGPAPQPHAPAPAPPAGTLGVRQTTVVGIVAVALFTVLNASSLVRVVGRQPFGWQRTVQLALVKPIGGLSHLLFLDRPRTAAD